MLENCALSEKKIFCKNEPFIMASRIHSNRRLIQSMKARFGVEILCKIMRAGLKICLELMFITYVKNLTKISRVGKLYNKFLKRRTVEMKEYIKKKYREII